jgi:hypothetical protein
LCSSKGVRPVLEHAVERRVLVERVRECTEDEVGDRRLLGPGVGRGDQCFRVDLPGHRDVDRFVVALLQSVRDLFRIPVRGRSSRTVRGAGPSVSVGIMVRSV